MIKLPHYVVTPLNHGTLLRQKNPEWKIPRAVFQIEFTVKKGDISRFGQNSLHYLEHVVYNLINEKNAHAAHSGKDKDEQDDKLDKTQHREQNAHGVFHTGNAFTSDDGRVGYHFVCDLKDIEAGAKQFFNGFADLAKGKWPKKSIIYSREQGRVSTETYNWTNEYDFLPNSDMFFGEFDTDALKALFINYCNLEGYTVVVHGLLADASNNGVKIPIDVKQGGSKGDVMSEDLVMQTDTEAIIGGGKTTSKDISTDDITHKDNSKSYALVDMISALANNFITSWTEKKPVKEPKAALTSVPPLSWFQKGTEKAVLNAKPMINIREVKPLAVRMLLSQRYSGVLMYEIDLNQVDEIHSGIDMYSQFFIADIVVACPNCTTEEVDEIIHTPMKDLEKKYKKQLDDIVKDK